MGLLDNGEPRKEPRAFSSRDKKHMLGKSRQDRRCVSCRKPISIKTSDADHVVPYSHGGITDPTNGQMLCKKCHKAKTKANREKYDHKTYRYGVDLSKTNVDGIL